MKYTLHLLVFTLLITPLALFAQGKDYIPLVGLPGAGGSTLGPGSSFEDYINAMYALSIGIAALLAVIKIIVAGVKWMLTDIVTSKEEAKKDIKGALLGLIVVLSAVLILNVINPNLTKATINLKPPPPHTPTSGVVATPSFDASAVDTVVGPNYTMSFLPAEANTQQQVLFGNSCEYIDSSTGIVQYVIQVGTDIRCISGSANLALDYSTEPICLNDDCTHPNDEDRLEAARIKCEAKDPEKRPPGRTEGTFEQDPIHPDIGYCFYERQ